MKGFAVRVQVSPDREDREIGAALQLAQTLTDKLEDEGIEFMFNGHKTAMIAISDDADDRGAMHVALVITMKQETPEEVLEVLKKAGFIHGLPPTK